jgi:hypothetical protein
MEKKINSIHKKVDEMCNVPDDILLVLQKDIAEIKVALLGNEYNPGGGLLYRVADLEKKVTQLQNKYEKAIWTTSAAAAVIAIIANLIMWLFDVWKSVPIDAIMK